ncbi:YfhO family protein [Mucilaginibacter sp.]|uniref:YfhO family protein n=1 Tax=Mucilaginibacter sp. TaxID=1882438 RepID=UPI003D0B023A
MNNWFKQNGIHLAIIGIFLAISFIYFNPAFQGKVLNQGDVIRAQATQKEIMDYHSRDTTILWTNQLFGGMPAFQIWTPYPHNITSYVVNALKATFPTPIDTVLLFLLGTYLLFCVLKLNPWLAGAGAIAFTFSTYNIILLDAGHANQAFAIAFFAPILAGILLTLRGRYLLGAALTAFFLAMEIRANHIQMTYYLLFAVAILVGAELYHAIKTKNTRPFTKAIMYLGAATLLALAVNASMLWTTYEYGLETNRGKSNLTQHTTEPGNGLSKEYAFAWSQGVGETMTFLVPNMYGSGSVVKLGDNSNIAQALGDKGIAPDQVQQYASQIAESFLYWGEKPFTEGPVYFGAVICFFFVFGLIFVKNRLKWWLLATVVLTTLLSFGKNFSLLSDLFFNYFPLYNKFRSVDSILGITGLCFAMLALLAINEIITAKDKAPALKKALLAFYITGGITLLIGLLPDLFFSFRNSSNQGMVDQLTQFFRGDTALANSIANAVVQDRISFARMDALRSFVFIAIAFGLLWAFIKQKINANVLSMVLFVLVLVDLWSVDKRFLNDDHFSAREDVQAPKPRDVDNAINQDKDPDYRVLDLSGGDPFTNASTSYFHKSIGGYHAAKLKRYDELQSSQFSQNLNQNVLNMLNTKYIITADAKTQSPVVHTNYTACGHAWFVKDIRFVKGADAEMQAITSFDAKNLAIVDQQYGQLASEKGVTTDTAGTIKLISYNPDHLVYQSSTTTPQIAVFSEIYYSKGWKMLVDGQEKPYFRADYLLRAAPIPAGSHKIEFIFHPASYYTGESISLAGSALLILALAGAVYVETRKKGLKA